ncbi:hypothetical protein VZT92_001976 [Zoarces viviparus]|uniref:CCHC-type domain-containing protein n=1 Tax=Zoarces viviparus TaxID=48416 RepID=A0AAW1G6K0_ZOAVI
MKAVEQFQAASDMLHPTRKEPIASVPARPGVPHQKGPKPANPHSGPPHRIVNPPWQQRGFLNPKARQCYRCGKVGHISWQCEKPDELMPTAESASSPHVHFAALLGEWGDRRPTCPVMVNERDVEALLNSGSARNLIHNSVLEASAPAHGDPVPVVCVHGDTHVSNHGNKADNH